MVFPQFIATNAGAVSITGVLKLFCAMDPFESLVKPTDSFSEICTVDFHYPNAGYPNRPGPWGKHFLSVNILHLFMA
jgi:hypothetical protein